MRLLLPAAALAVALVFAASCGGSNPICDDSDQTDIAGQIGSCSGITLDRGPSGMKVLGSKSSCNSNIPKCSDADETVLKALMDCWGAVPACAAGNEANFQSLANSCERRRNDLSESCKQAFFGTSGTDAGSTDAEVLPPQPEANPDGSLDLFITADETSIAMAWTRSQKGTVAEWKVYAANAAGLREAPVSVTPDSRMFYTNEGVGAGTKKQYFVHGLNAAGQVVMGDPSQQSDAGGTGPDGGTLCTDHTDCDVDQVCSGGTCGTQNCADNSECPAVGGYTCDTSTNPGVCRRTQDAGVPDGGVPEEAKPFESELQVISTPSAPPVPFSSPELRVSNFGGRNMDVAPIDTARHFVISEYEGQILGYYTQDRGQKYEIIAIDSKGGTNPHIAYEPKSRLLFACYNAQAGIRVRVSKDYGRSWGDAGGAHLINEAPDDGGVPTAIQDCDIAPWIEGSAIVVAVEDDIVKSWTVNGNLSAQGPDVVFASGASIFSPRDLAIATLPNDFIVHVVFTVTRLIQNPSGSTTSAEVKAQYRDANSSGGFEDRGFVNQTDFPSLSAFDEYTPAVVVDPVTKRGLAAFIAKDPNGYETIYLSLWSTTNKNWRTGPDLNVFVQHPTSRQFVVIPDRPTAETWVATSPSLAVTPKGRLALAFAAGRAISSTNVTLNPFFVEFGFEAYWEIRPQGKGWFMPPARRLSLERVVSRAGAPHGGPIIAADQQISFYIGFMEAGAESQTTPLWPNMVMLPK